MDDLNNLEIQRQREEEQLTDLEIQRQREEEQLNNPALRERALEQKTRRFVPRGFLILAIGILLLVIGLLLHTGVRSPEGVLVGVGIIVIIIGIIQVLIGLIKPIVPEQINPPLPPPTIVDPDDISY